jgi:hypothetical protein
MFVIVEVIGKKELIGHKKFNTYDQAERVLIHLNKLLTHAGFYPKYKIKKVN